MQQRESENNFFQAMSSNPPPPQSPPPHPSLSQPYVNNKTYIASTSFCHRKCSYRIIIVEMIQRNRYITTNKMEPVGGWM